jgi:hypothetical protein
LEANSINRFISVVIRELYSGSAFRRLKYFASRL